MLAVSDTGVGMDERRAQRASSSRSSPPRSPARAPASGSPRSTASSSRAAAPSAVHSEPGQGTTFKIYLPRVDGAGPGARRRRRLGPTRHGAETILLVEDEDAVRALAAPHPDAAAATRCSRPRNGGEALLTARRARGPHPPAADRRGDAGDERPRAGAAASTVAAGDRRCSTCPATPTTRSSATASSTPGAPSSASPTRPRN